MKKIFHFVLNSKRVLVLFIVALLAPSMSCASMANYSTRSRWSTSDILKMKIAEESKAPSPMVQLEMFYPDTAFPKLNDEFEIPYVGKMLNIGERKYNASEIIRVVDDVRLKMMQALQNHAVGNRDSLRLDFRDVKKTVDSLKLGNLFSSINLILKEAKNRKWESLDLLTSVEDSVLTGVVARFMSIEFNLKTKSQKIDLGSIKGESEIKIAVVIDFEVDKIKGKSVLKTKFKLFSLEMPSITAEMTKKELICIKDDFLKITVTKDRIQSNIEIKESLAEAFSFKNSLKRLDENEIPFINKFYFSLGGINLSLKDAISEISDYNKLFHYYLVSSLCHSEKAKANLEHISDSLKNYINKIIPLKRIAISKNILTDKYDDYTDKDFVYFMGSQPSASGVFQMKEGLNVIVTKISLPKLKCVKNVDFDLLNAKDFDVETDVYFKYFVKFFKNDHEFILEDLIIDKIVMNLTTNKVSMNLAAFNALLGSDSKNFGKLRYHVYLGPQTIESTNVKHSSIELEYESMTIVANDRVVKTFKNKNNKNRLVYDFWENEWVIPYSIKSYASITTDDILNQTYSVINALRNLRAFVNDKSNGFSAETVKNVSSFEEKLEQVIYGDGTEKCQYGLFEHNFVKLPNEWRKRIAYKKRYSNLFDFVKKYNEAWKIVFRGDSLEKPCEFKYLDVKKNEITDETASKVAYVKLVFNLGTNIDPVLVKKLDEQLSEISPNGKARVDANGNVLIELTMDLKR